MSAHRRSPRADGSLGQASLEHVAVVALVALVLGAGGAGARAWAPNLTNSVTSAVRRALCVAGGDRCAEAHRPRACVVGSRERRQHVEMTAIFRVGGDGAILREERSDGSVRVTWVDDASLAAKAAAPGAKADLGGEEGDGEPPPSRSVEASADAHVGLELGRRLQWEVPSRAAADVLVRRLASRADELLMLRSRQRELQRLLGERGVRPADALGVRVGAAGGAEGAASLPVALEAKLGGRLAGAAEVWWDRRRRRATLAIDGAGALSGDVTGPLGAQVGGKAELQRRVELVLDGDGRPRDLVLRGRVQAWADAAGVRVGGPRSTAKGKGGGRRWNLGDRELEAHLDLTDPALANQGADLVAAVRDGRARDVGRVLRELGGRVASEASIDVRRYETSTTRRPWGASVAAGVKIGVEMETSRTGRRLVQARSRPPGGTWESRLDCGVRGS